VFRNATASPPTNMPLDGRSIDRTDQCTVPAKIDHVLVGCLRFKQSSRNTDLLTSPSDGTNARFGANGDPRVQRMAE
jgi:hypothetical protein